MYILKIIYCHCRCDTCRCGTLVHAASIHMYICNTNHLLIVHVSAGNWSFVWYRGQQHSHIQCCQHQRPQSLEGNATSSSSSNVISDTELEDLYADTALHETIVRPMEDLPPTNLFPVSYTTSTPRKCCAIARTGLPCRLPALQGLKYCHRHLKTN